MENGLAVLELSSGWQRKRPALQSVQAWQNLTFNQEAEDLGRVNTGPGSTLDCYPNGGGNWVFPILAGVSPHSFLRLANFQRNGAKGVKENR